MSNRVVIVSGPPASGKTTVAQLVASRYERSVHVEADRFFGFVVGGYVDPWEPGSHDQNGVINEIVCDAARRYAEAGYLTVLDGIFIPGWFYERVRDRLRASSIEVASVFLRPGLPTAMARARERVPPKRLDEEVLDQLWRSFDGLGPLEYHVIENDGQSVDETADLVVRRLEDGSLRA